MDGLFSHSSICQQCAQWCSVIPWVCCSVIPLYSSLVLNDAQSFRVLAALQRQINIILLGRAVRRDVLYCAAGRNEFIDKYVVPGTPGCISCSTI
eukprot:1158780-Pelagomonas_calceolata.AAC.2